MPFRLLMVLACFGAQMVVALVTVPPWQNPDEPQHLMAVRQVLAYGPYDRFDSLEPGAERAIVASMIRYQWWEHYGRETPNPAPTSFQDGPAKVVRAYFGPPDGGSRLYYRFVASLFNAAHVEDLLAQLYVMRALSAIFAMLTLGCVWVGTQTMLDRRSALVVSAIVALQPQFVLVSTTAGPDALVNLAGGVFWWRAATLLTREVTGLRAAWLLAAGIAAFLIRRMGAPLVLVALGATAARLWPELNGTRPRRVTTALGLSVVGVALVVIAWSLLPAEVHRAFAWIQFDPVQSITGIVSRAGGLPGFVETLFTTFWLSAGWLRYYGPAWWYGVTLVVSLVAAAGVLAPRVESVAERRARLLALAMFTLQVAVVVAFYFGILQTSPQGRYLFPVLPAIVSLLWLGWRRWFAAHEQPGAAVSLIAIVGVLNIAAWVLVIAPAYP